MDNAEVKRSTRVAESVRGELMSILLTGAVHDPGIEGALVSNVLVTDDLRTARIYIRLLDADVTPPKKAAVLRACERAKGFLRRELGNRIQLKYTPELKFFWDDTFDEAIHMDSLLAEVRDEEGPKE
jgi:ribosome-binding factor A